MIFDAETRKYTEVYSKYYPMIFSTVYTKINNVPDAKDVCQEVFIRLFEKFEEVRDHRKWILGTMRNVTLEYYRKKNGNDVDIDEAFNDLSLTFVNGFRDTRMIIEEALENMENFNDEEEKIIFHLIAINNYTYKKVGSYLGLTERQVRYRYNRITEKLIQYFKKKGINSLEELL